MNSILQRWELDHPDHQQDLKQVLQWFTDIVSVVEVKVVVGALEWVENRLCLRQILPVELLREVLIEILEFLGKYRLTFGIFCNEPTFIAIANSRTIA